MLRVRSSRALLACALAAAALAPTSRAQLKIYDDPAGTGDYVQTHEFDLTFEEALRYFSLAGGSPWTGEGQVLNVKRTNGVRFDGPQSWDGFVRFLDENFDNVAPLTALCDDVVRLTGPITWSCAIMPDPCPGAGCDGFFESATAPFACLNIPACPGARPSCTKLRVALNIVAFNTLGGTACTCAGPACVVGPGLPSGRGIMHDNNVCECRLDIVTINEVYVSHTGTDDQEYIELLGPPLFPLDGLMVLVIEGDGAAAGTLDRAWDLTGQVITNPGGYFTLGDTAMGPDLDIGGSNTIENGTETIYLIETDDPVSILALLGTDVDSDDDGVTDIALMTGVEVLDLVGIRDDDAGDVTYDFAETLGPDASGFLPSGIFRDRDYPGLWCANDYLDFDDVANADEPRTPGNANAPCPDVGPSYCTSGTTTSGCQAKMTAVGIPSASLASPFTLLVKDVEGAKLGIIFYGVGGPTAVPWGMSTSFLCVKAPTQRTGPQNAGGLPGTCDGVLRLDWNLYQTAKPTALGNPFSSGDDVWAQGWFRDPPSPKTTHLSDGLMFTMQP